MADPRSFNLPDRTILPANSNDRLGLAILALTREIWVLKDRTMVLEEVLKTHGIDAACEIEAFQPDEARAKRLGAEGNAIIAAITEILSGEKT